MDIELLREFIELVREVEGDAVKLLYFWLGMYLVKVASPLGVVMFLGWLAYRLIRTGIYHASLPGQIRAALREIGVRGLGEYDALNRSSRQRVIDLAVKHWKERS